MPGNSSPGSAALNAPIHVDGYPVEVRTLGNAFSAVLERLEDSFSRLSRFSADIAHELRTPVNNIRGESEVALAPIRTPEDYTEVLSSCLEGSVRLSELIESLLFLARSESPGDHLKRTREELAALLAGLREYYDPAATEAGVERAESGANLHAEVDKALLQRALGNLVSNALAHCSAGDRIQLRAVRHNGTVRLEVHDSGAGIPPEPPAGFRPLLPCRSGLLPPCRGRRFGLAIVQQIVFPHGGTVEIAVSPAAALPYLRCWRNPGADGWSA
jgi:two-component system heavy metal sensor histidine kinase CusS